MDDILAKNEVIDYLGAGSWAEVAVQFEEHTLDEILIELDFIWPEDDNKQLANSILVNLRRGTQ